MAEIERSASRVRGFDDPEFDFQLMRTLGAGVYGGAAVGECFQAVAQITDRDPKSWVAAWSALADQLAGRARDALDRKHHASARDAFLRASAYYRTAEYYSDTRFAHRYELGLLSRDTFCSAGRLFVPAIEPVEIPSTPHPLPGYLVAPATETPRAKTLLVLNGYDGTAEESFFMIGRLAAERGYRVLLFEGPGQTGYLRLHRDGAFRPDYEVPIGSAVDFALGLPGADAKRLALYGISFGGHLVTRAAIHEPRLGALIANSPILDWHRYLLGFMGSRALKGEDLAVDEIDAIDERMLPPHEKWAAAQLCTKFGARSFFEAMKNIEAYRVESLASIHCPALALVGEGEGDEAIRQTNAFCDKVSGSATMVHFTVADGADAHCQVNHLALAGATILDWLDEHFG